MNIIPVTTTLQLDTLYNESALTWEGWSSDEKSLNAIREWLKKHEALTHVEPDFHIIKGKFMNEQYGLSGDNAYPEDCTLVSVTDINQMKIALQRFEVGGRWFDDIVDNNTRRKEELK